MLAAVLAAVCGCEKLRSPTPARPASRPAAEDFGEDYARALAVADQFCEAWRLGDVAIARLLVSQRLRRLHGDGRLNEALAAAPNANHVGFEISEGRRLGEGRYVFRVRLVRRYLGRQEDRIEAPPGQIVLAAQQDGQWRVDELPLPVP